MGVTRTDSEQTAEHQLGSDAPTAEHAVPSRRAEAQAPTPQLASPGGGENCSNCGAPLASDQRYCIQCGQRRGNGRFALAGPAAMTATTVTTSGPPPLERSRWHGSAATVIAGIATLVLAMGVGVLIGHSGSTNSAKAAPPTVLTVGGGSSVGTSGGSTGGSTTHAARHHTAAPKTERARATKAATAKKPTTQAVQKASHAASSVLGGNSGGQQQSTISNGATCKPGSAGCTNGHFTGNFFGQ